MGAGTMSVISKKIEVRRRRWSGLLCERENRLIKNDMTRDDDFVGSKVKAAVTFVMSRVSQKDAHDRTSGEFMWGDGRDVWIALTAKDTEMRIRRWGAEQGCMRRGEVQWWEGC